VAVSTSFNTPSITLGRLVHGLIIGRSTPYTARLYALYESAACRIVYSHVRVTTILSTIKVKVSRIETHHNSTPNLFHSSFSSVFNSLNHERNKSSDLGGSVPEEVSDDIM